MFSDISFGFATQMLELAHRLPVDLRLSTAGPRSLVPAPATRTSLDANLFKNWNLGGLEYLIFHPTHYRTGALFPANFSTSPAIEFSWTLVAPHSLKNSSMLVILHSVLFFLGCSLLLCSHFLHRNAKGQGWRMDGFRDGGLKDGISFWLEAVFAVFPWLRLPTFRSFWC